MFAKRCVEDIKVFNKDTQLIGDTFSKASKSYKKYSELQDRCSVKLRDSIELSGTVLDLGSGLGTHYELDSNQVICVDIALGMLNTLQQSYPEYTAINADAAALPLQNQSVDTVISNLALQWCDDFQKVVSELHRVLQNAGEMAISLVAANSLPELCQLGFKTNQFNSITEYQSAFKNTDWEMLEYQVRREVVYFDNLKSLIYSIKGVGASAIKRQNLIKQKQRLRGKSDWQNILDKAEKLRTDRGLPLSYNIVQIKARKLG